MRAALASVCVLQINQRAMKKLFTTLFLLFAADAAHAQVVTTLPAVVNSVTDFGNGPMKFRVVQGSAFIFTSQGSGVGSTSGSSTALTLTATPATPPAVGGAISGAGISSGTTVVAFNGTTGVTMSAAMNVPAASALAWGAACPGSVGSAPYIQGAAGAGYYILYTQARVCAASPGGPANAVLTLPIELPNSGGGGSVSFANPTATAGPAGINGSAVTAMRSDAAPAVQVGSNTQKGLLQYDGTGICGTSGVISLCSPYPTVPVAANPTATAGSAAVNGSAATFMRSDGAPAVQGASSTQPGLVPAWPGNTTTFFRGDGTYAPLNFSAIAGQWALAQGPTMGAGTALGSVAGGTPTALSAAQITALINVATASLSGALPAWPNNITTYFRGDGSYATLNYAALGTAPIANGGTGQTTQQAALNALAPTPTRAGDVMYYNGTNWVSLPGNNSGTQFLQETAAGVPSWATVSGTGTLTTQTAGAGIVFSSGATCTTTCTVSLALTNATLQASPANPTATANTTGVMMGLGTTCKLTPVYSGRIKLEFIGVIANSGTATTQIKVFFGTGTAPANAAAIAGTQVGNVLALDEPTATFQAAFANGGVITGLTPGTAYWFDLSLAASAGTSTMKNVSCNAVEL